MHDDDYSVNRAFESLRSTRWTGEPSNEGGQSHKNELEERLMQEFHNRKTGSALSRHRGLVAVLAFVLIGGVGFGATLAPEAVKKWFVKLTLIGPNGTQIDGVMIEAVDDDGDGAVTMRLGSVDADMTTIELQEVDGASAGADSTMDITISQVSIDGGPVDVDDQATEIATTIFVANGDGEVVGEALLQKIPMVQVQNRSAIIEQIETIEPIDQWEDEEANLHELHLLSAPVERLGKSGMLVCDSYVDEEGQRIFRIVGTVLDADAETTELVDIAWDEEGIATLRFLTEDGGEMTTRFDSNWEADTTSLEPTQVRIQLGTDFAPEDQ